MRQSSGNSRVQASATNSVAQPPMTTAGIAPSQRGYHAGLEFAEFVRRADEHRVHRADAAADVVGRLELHEQVADVDAHHVAGAEHGERDERNPEARRHAEHERCEPEDDHAAEHPVADALRDRQHAQHDAGQRRADARRRSQPAESARADVQHVGGIHRQQRRRAAEQHRKQVEGDCTQHGTSPAHEPQSFEQRVAIERRRAGSPTGFAAAAQRREHHQRHGQQRRHGGVNGSRTREIQQAAERRTDDRRHLPQRGIEGDGRAEVLALDEVRQQRLARWHGERTGDAEQRHDAEHGQRAAQAMPRECEQQQCAEQQQPRSNP